MKQCLYSKCGIEFEPTKPKQKFCCAVHKTYWHREQNKVVVKNLNNLTVGVKETQKKAAQNESINTERVADLEKELASLPENNSRITNMRRVFLIKEINKAKVL